VSFDDTAGKTMRRLLSLPWQAEFAIVIFIAFGWFTYVSLHIFLVGHPGVVVSGSEKLHLVGFEVLVMIVLGAFLHARGWTLMRLGLAPSWRDTAIGIVLAGVSYLLYRVAWIAVCELSPSLARTLVVHTTLRSQISPFSMVALLTVNPLFEEVFVAGYVITVLKEKYGAVVAVSTSLTIRVLYHLYQGVGGLLSHIPDGLLFGMWYVRTRRLWPLVIAHAALVLYSLRHYIGAGGF
jgi:membrane protease YdiL (CAAX protease family)